MGRMGRVVGDPASPTLINVFRAAVNSTFFEEYADRRGLTTRGVGVLRSPVQRRRSESSHGLCGRGCSLHVARACSGCDRTGLWVERYLCQQLTRRRLAHRPRVAGIGRPLGGAARDVIWFGYT